MFPLDAGCKRQGIKLKFELKGLIMILAARVLQIHTGDVRTNFCYGNVMTHVKTWNLIVSSAYKLLIP